MQSLASKQNLRALRSVNAFSLRLLVSVLLIFSSSVYANTVLPKSTNTPGGVAIVALKTNDTKPPTVFYRNLRTLIIPDPSKQYRWLSVIGIPIDAKPGKHFIELLTDHGVVQQEFMVTKKNYPTEKLTISNKRKVKPLPEDLPKIEAQYIETIQTYEHWEYRHLDSVVLHLPTKGRKSSPFGLRRIMNNIPQNPHSGLDIAAAKGSPVMAPKAARVLNIGDFFYSGKIVFLDHGQGFITSYCHLDTISVTKGQHLRKGDIIGTIGNTGRATGAHLHWSVSLNGVRIDPQLFIYE